MTQLTLNSTDIVIGGRDNANNIPAFNSSKWGDYGFIDLNYESMQNPSYQRVGNSDIYQKSAEQFTVWEHPTIPDVLEASLTFASKPSSPVIRFKVTKPGSLSLHPQGELTQEEIDLNSIRPDNVIGSYALYIDKAHNEFKTGKLGHWYRWSVIDNNGNLSWCTHWTFDGTYLECRMDEAFLNNASYPIVAMGHGDTFGYSAIGGSSTSFTNSIAPRANLGVNIYTAASGDTITSYHIYGKKIASNSEVGLAVYSGASSSSLNGGARLQPETLITINSTTNQWWASATVSHGLTASAVYAVAWRVSSTKSFSFNYDSGFTDSRENTAGSMDATWTEASTGGFNYSAYVTYTAGGGGGSVAPLAYHHYHHNLK